MKPLQIGLLVAAGALGGALVMKWQSTRHASPAPVPVVASAPAMPAPAVTPAEPTPPPEPPAAAPPAAPPERPSPIVRPKPARKAPPAPVAPAVQPAVIAQNDAPPPPQPTQPVQPPPPAAAEPAPPARTAPPAAAEPVPAPRPAEPNRVTLTSGTLIPVRLADGLSTERNLPGDTFTATLDAPLAAGGFVIAERGARVEGKVVESTKAGKVSGVSSLGIVLTRIQLSDGQRVSIDTQTFTRKGQSSRGEDAAKIGAGAGIGAIIGAIAGGGKGAGIGAGVGGAAGAGDVLLTRGKPATLPTETRINFRLAQPVLITERR